MHAALALTSLNSCAIYPFSQMLVAILPVILAP